MRDSQWEGQDLGGWNIPIARSTGWPDDAGRMKPIWAEAGIKGKLAKDDWEKSNISTLFSIFLSGFCCSFSSASLNFFIIWQ